MTPAYLSPIANHLWQSTLFAAAAGLLAFTLRKHNAHVRYCLWLAASVKFLVPFSLLMTAGRLIEWRSAAPAALPLSGTLEQVVQPFAPQPPFSEAVAMAAPSTPILTAALLALWLCGVLAVLLRWRTGWRRIRAAFRVATPLPLNAPIPVMSSPELLAPGVFGIFRLVLLLPCGISERLPPAQLHAIFAHELCHARRRDNLAFAIHMGVQTIFWFHPVVWWIGSRLIEERERACDQEVLTLGNQPLAYAEGILNVCKFYLESPLACAAGVTGANLKKRIEAIMAGHSSSRLTRARKLLLAGAAAADVAVPVLIGMLNAPAGRAQTQSAAGVFEVASIKPSDPEAHRMGFGFAPGGGINAMNVSLRDLIAFAYNLQCGKAASSSSPAAPPGSDPRDSTYSPRGRNRPATMRTL